MTTLCLQFGGGVGGGGRMGDRLFASAAFPLLTAGPSVVQPQHNIQSDNKGREVQGWTGVTASGASWWCQCAHDAGTVIWGGSSYLSLSERLLAVIPLLSY